MTGPTPEAYGGSSRTCSSARAFYREKLAAGHATDAGGLAAIARLPLTRRRSCARRSRAENPFGAHLCAEPREIVRIYSTSGTTGTPSYIPLTAPDLENWIETSARSYAASGVQRGERIVSHLQRRAVRGRRRARRVRAHRALPHPGRHGQHRAAACARSSCCGPTPR